MGVAVMLLVFLLGPTVYAQLSGCPFSFMLEKFVHQIDEFLGGENEMKTIKSIEGVIETVTREPQPQKKYKTAFTQDVYVPIFPRRPPILLWPSVMNPAVTKAVAKNLRHRGKNQKEKIECDKELAVNERITPFERSEIRSAMHEFDNFQLYHAPGFFKKLIPELIEWLSAEALECGFFTMFKREEQQINRYIAANRRPWIRTLQDLVYILIKTIAVIHHKTNVFQSGPVYGSLNWIDNWVQSYEHWYRNFATPLEYFETFVLNSFDIVMAWLFDQLASSPYPRNHSNPFLTYSSRNQWALSDDPEIVCGLASYYTASHYAVRGVSWGVSWEYTAGFSTGYSIKNREGFSTDFMNIMADLFLECKVKGECKGPYVNDSDTFVKIPSTSCVFTCNSLPPMKPHGSMPQFQQFQYDPKILAYAHAHMTTEVAHELYCSVNSTDFIPFQNRKLEVTKQCYPLIVEKYIMERLYKICISSDCKCCSVDQEVDPPDCDIFSSEQVMWEPDMTFIADIKERNK